MKVGRLRDMKGGWFVGAFEPTVLDTDACEVCVKTYRQGEVNAMHFHKIATETTLILIGRATMNGVEYGAGDIIVVEPDERSDFVALTDVTLVVVKVPGVTGDKYTD